MSWRTLQSGHSLDYRLVQCTVGSEIEIKAREVELVDWTSWIKFNEIPKIALAVPYQLNHRSISVRQVENLGVLVLDRLRFIEEMNAYRVPMNDLGRQIIELAFV